MQHTEKRNPIAVQAEIRRRQWEAEAEKARDRNWLTTPRFDALDTIFFVLGAIGVTVLVLTALI